MDGKLDINNIALKAPKKTRRESQTKGLFTFLWGPNDTPALAHPANSKNLREEYGRIMEQYYEDKR